MRRREVIAGLAAAAAWPLAARAQQPAERTRRIGILGDERWPPIDSLKQGLRNLGYVEGQNLEIVYCFAAGQAERYPGLAAELVALPVELIVTLGTPASVAAKRATEAIPIVVQTGDPVAAGLVRDLAHPGGNVTGFSGQAADAEGKRLGLLKELLPSLSRVAVLVNPANSLSAVFLDNARSGAIALGLRLDPVEASSVPELERALHRATQRPARCCAGDRRPRAAVDRQDANRRVPDDEPAALHLQLSRACAGGWPHGLRCELSRHLPPERGARYRQDFEGHQARRPSCPAAHGIPADLESQDREGARPDCPTDPPRARRRGDRMRRREVGLRSTMRFGSWPSAAMADLSL